jgi:hypothetical protein
LFPCPGCTEQQIFCFFGHSCVLQVRAVHLRNALVDVEQEFIDAAADARGKAFRIVIPVPLFIESVSNVLH